MAEKKSICIEQHQVCREELTTRLTVLETRLKDLNPVQVRDFMATTLKTLEDLDAGFDRLETAGLVQGGRLNKLIEEIPKMINKVRIAAAYQKGKFVVVLSLVSAAVGGLVGFFLSKYAG